MAASATFDFIVFYVADPAASLAYFTDVLGFARVTHDDGPSFYTLTGGEGGLHFGLMQATSATPAAGSAELYVKIANAQEKRDEVIAKGIAATPIAAMPFGSIFTVRTPDDYPLVMLQTPDQP